MVRRGHLRRVVVVVGRWVVVVVVVRVGGWRCRCRRLGVGVVVMWFGRGRLVVVRRRRVVVVRFGGRSGIGRVCFSQWFRWLAPNG